eukprot:1206855-Amorphochlora_amoeboformis.AAC.1
MASAGRGGGFTWVWLALYCILLVILPYFPKENPHISTGWNYTRIRGGGRLTQPSIKRFSSISSVLTHLQATDRTRHRTLAWLIAKTDDKLSNTVEEITQLALKILPNGGGVFSRYGQAWCHGRRDFEGGFDDRGGPQGVLGMAERFRWESSQRMLGRSHSLVVLTELEKTCPNDFLRASESVVGGGLILMVTTSAEGLGTLFSSFSRSLNLPSSI